jgi:enediyne biosynthesis protein E5
MTTATHRASILTQDGPTVPDRKKPVRDPRNGLRMSASLATVFTILGHTVLGFEQPLAAVFVALGTGYLCALLFEFVDAWACSGTPNYLGGGWKKLVDFLLPAHMTSITLSFLLYTFDQMWPLAFTVAISIGAKHVLRVEQRGRLQHFMNPSNFGAVICFAIFQWTTVLPWSFTTTVGGVTDWVIPIVIVMLGTRLNLLFTGRLPLIGAWLGSYAVISFVRSMWLGSPWAAEVVMFTGIPLVLFTFYMITDPQTSPSRLRSQIIFGMSIAIAYEVLLAMQVQYTMFYAVGAVCAARGSIIALQNVNVLARLGQPLARATRLESTALTS